MKSMKSIIRPREEQPTVFIVRGPTGIQDGWIVTPAEVYAMSRRYHMTMLDMFRILTESPTAMLPAEW